MHNLMSQEPPWALKESFSPEIDFCIWVLEGDGLRVPPFDRHAEGDGSLRARSMNAPAWQSWVTRIVLLLDQRLLWHIEDQQSSVAENVDAFERIAAMASKANPQLNLPVQIDGLAIHSSLKNLKAWQEQQYQQAATAVRQIYGESHPPNIWISNPSDIWDGNPSVGELLRELWSRYQSVFGERENNWSEQLVEDPGGQRLYDALIPYQIRIASLALYLVAYPEPVEYLVPPVSAILSVNNERSGSDTFKERVLHAAEGLAVAGNS